MAKTTEEIKELLATELFRKGIAKKYIVVNNDYTMIQYNCKNQTRRKLSDPEAKQLQLEATETLEKAKRELEEIIENGNDNNT